MLRLRLLGQDLTVFARTSPPRATRAHAHVGLKRCKHKLRIRPTLVSRCSHSTVHLRYLPSVSGCTAWTDA